jgi:hypothetical protein
LELGSKQHSVASGSLRGRFSFLVKKIKNKNKASLSISHKGSVSLFAFSPIELDFASPDEMNHQHILGTLYLAFLYDLNTAIHI